MVTAPQVPRPRRRLTQAEFDEEINRARPVLPPDLSISEPKPLRTRTGRRRSWWMRGWKR